MAYNEFLFAFVLVPAYLGGTFVLSRASFMRRMPVALSFAIDWAIAAAAFGTFAALTGLADGNWQQVSLWSGLLAATIATTLAVRFAPKPALR